ncbi:MAG TPA: M20/M25/M40 family metallo-hydrolase [Gaiellaceae bacterium]|nr:M20/M25/M40 family metallo-hydrolase [Gaiellaceae bacterium]
MAWLDELAELVAIPSVSADPAHADDVKAAAEWLAGFVRGAGGEADVVPTETQPLILGDLPASNGTAPTVLVYGHVDVQPPDPLELWESDPFSLEERDGWLYGRGVADDKGQLYLLVKAAAELHAAGELPVNVRVACDAEEETGGHQIVDFLAADERGADAAVIFDSAMTTRGSPEFNVTTRGLVYFHLEVRTGTRDLHSGLFGGAALNALHALNQILAAVLVRDGVLPEPLREGVVPPTDEEVAAWAELVPGSQMLAGSGGRKSYARADEEFYLRTTSEPSLDVNGIAGGSAVLQKTVLPAVAEANLSIRLAPGQDVETIASALERLLREAAPEGAELQLTCLSSAAPGLIRPDEAVIQRGLEAFERTFGRRPLLVRSGGTLPIVPALVDKGIPTIITGFATPESNIHSPNERLLAEYVPLGIETAKELFRSLAGLGA